MSVIIMLKGRKSMLTVKEKELFDKIYYYIVKEDKTLRDVSILLNISKSVLHRKLHSDKFRHYCDMKDCLCGTHNSYMEVQIILNDHFMNKYIKGGDSTRKLYHNEIIKGVIERCNNEYSL